MNNLLENKGLKNMNAKNIKKFIYYLLEVNVLVAVFRDVIIIYPKSVKLNSIYLLLFFFFYI